MTIIKITVRDQMLIPRLNPTIASGGIEENKVKFTFSEHWTGFTKKAVFYNGTNVNEVNLVNDECVIPSFVTSAVGAFKIGVYGTRENAKRTSNVIEYDVRTGTSTTASNPCAELEAVLDYNITKYSLTGITITRGNWTKDLESVQELCDAINEQGGGQYREAFEYMLDELERVLGIDTEESDTNE